ncbi:MAG: transposase [Alteromonadaceae bacterium]|nr:MAG: transposase [Alteromonadaceae bacterium]
MPRPRKQQVSLSDTPYYHVISRCVRRGYLCGEDHTTGVSYEHRRQWIADRIRILSALFAIDICSYAVMGNHYHIVIKLMPQQADHWSEADVINRWLAIHKGPLLVQKYVKRELLDDAEQAVVKGIVAVWRSRLSDLSWFMKLLNEPIARKANQEDKCTGHFWESRFRSDPLLTEQALLSCMAYVDLNPIRAKMADTPENSNYTSIQERIKPQFNLAIAVKNCEELDAARFQVFDDKQLLAFDGNIKANEQTGILFSFRDYLTLVDTTGRIQREGKRGFIPATLMPILERLNMQMDEWVEGALSFERIYRQRYRKRPQSNAA